jgi:hypothetical protein
MPGKRRDDTLLRGMLMAWNRSHQEWDVRELLKDMVSTAQAKSPRKKLADSDDYMLLRDLLTSWSRCHPEWDLHELLGEISITFAQQMSRERRAQPDSPMPSFEDLLRYD